MSGRQHRKPIFLQLCLMVCCLSLYESGNAASAQVGMDMDYLQRAVAAQQCPTVLQEYDYLLSKDYCPEQANYSNEEYNAWRRCIDEVFRQNQLITNYNGLVRICRQKSEANRAANAPSPQPVVTYSPSFDCSLASTSTEHAICGSESLSAQDRSMSVSYSQLRDRSPAPDAVRQRQREWLAERNSCGAEVGCIGTAYDWRLGEINDEMDMVANDEMHATQDTYYEPEADDSDEWQESDGDSQAWSDSSDIYCTDVPVIADELYNRSCNRGEDCYYSIIERFGISCIP